MIKVVHISTSKHGGAGLAAYRIHDALNKSGKVESFFIQREKGECDSEKKIFYAPIYKPYSSNIFYRIYRKIKPYESPENNPIRKYVKNFSSNFEIVTYPDSSYRIENHPLVQEADIIHLHWVGEFLNYRTFFEKINKPIVWTLHDMNPFQGLFHYKEDEVRNIKTLGRFDRKMIEVKKRAFKSHKNIHIVCYAKWMYEVSKNSELFENFHHHFIPQGVDFSEFNLFDIIEEKKKINLNNGKKTLLFLAQSLENYRKGGDLLINALCKLKNKDFNLITIGYTKEDLDIPSEINHFHYNHTKSVQELYKFYAISDITILPSREDNLPNVLIESLSNGTPVLSFKIGGMLDHIHENYTGLFAEALSSDSLAVKIDEFIAKNIDFNASLIRKYAVQNFSAENQVKNYIELYQTLL